ncbi:phosphatidylinositol glycan anchor biosynthesis class Q isoform X2 [Choristoneura fumiferana]|uniref:phosphatidylinositol glycan anchor biosynthesis class Q isoform X2 n=1 Tax=Choristoneura fumiferana TaxID=7141 RepID=UPI003D15C7D5
MPRKPLKILLPILPKNLKDYIYLKGFLSISELEIVVYFVKYSIDKDLVWKGNREDRNVIYGLYNGTLTKLEKNTNNFPNFVVFKHHSAPQIKKIFLNNTKINFTENCIVMLYEYEKIKNTGILCESSEYIRELQMLIQKHSTCTGSNQRSFRPVIKNPFWLSYTMFGQHIVNCINLAYWLFISLKKDKKVSIKQGNLIIAVIMDIMLGYFILQLVTLNEKELSEALMGVLEKLVNYLYTLLKWLMGAPAGLKLNNAFNKMLGKYFSYHTQLWWLFLDVTGEKLDVILHLFHYIGLFNIQVSGLIALLRLFVGRKYNPLRGGIDSCEYTNQELFVGTVAFTILLLLMPTTAMYYAVFTLFRLLSLVVQHILTKLIYLMHTQPTYVIALWLTKSNKVAGNILMEVVSSEDASPVILKLNLLTKPVQDLIQNFKPPVEVPKHMEWTNLLSNVLTGKQII